MGILNRMSVSGIEFPCLCEQGSSWQSIVLYRIYTLCASVKVCLCLCVQVCFPTVILPKRCRTPGQRGRPLKYLVTHEYNCLSLEYEP